MATSSPAFFSAAAPAGITATRVSPGQVSFGIPTLMAAESLVDFAIRVDAAAVDPSRA